MEEAGFKISYFASESNEALIKKIISMYNNHLKAYLLL